MFFLDLDPWTDNATTDNLQVKVGGYVLIDVPPISSYPDVPSSTPTAVKWFENGAEINLNSVNYHMSKTKQLAILDIQSSLDSHKFYVVLNNPFVGLSTRSKSFQLDVSGKFNSSKQNLLAGDC